MKVKDVVALGYRQGRVCRQTPFDSREACREWVRRCAGDWFRIQVIKDRRVVVDETICSLQDLEQLFARADA